MYHPTTAPNIATIVPASSALTMNGKVNSARRSAMGSGESCVLTSPHQFVPRGVMVRGLGLTDHDQSPAGRAQHLDRRTVELGQRRGRDHLLDGAAHRPPAGHVDHLVEV